MYCFKKSLKLSFIVVLASLLVSLSTQAMETPGNDGPRYTCPPGSRIQAELNTSLSENPDNNNTFSDKKNPSTIVVSKKTQKIYESGEAAEKAKEYERALFLYKDAKTNNHPYAHVGIASVQFELGLDCAFAGEKKEAAKWFLKVANNDYSKPLTTLAREKLKIFYTPKTFNRLVTVGYDINHQYKNGQRYEENEKYGDALRWYKAAMKNGHPNGKKAMAKMQFKLGDLAKDPGEAVWWFTKAANNDYLKAYDELARIYKNAFSNPKKAKHMLALRDQHATKIRREEAENTFSKGL